MTKNKKIISVGYRALMLLILLTMLCGVIYPLTMTGISQLAFSKQANGSIIEIDGKKYGSVLLAQQFTGEEYLWGRVMELNTQTFIGEDGQPMMYAEPSNQSPASEEYGALIEERVAKLRQANTEQGDEPIPVDLVTMSGSGLDPHISPQAADYQIARIANARNMEESKVKEIIERYTEGRFLGIFGEKRVNVLQVNLALDGILG